MTRPEDLAALARLLDHLFEVDELRRFVALTPDVGNLLDQVPGPTAAPAAVSFAIVQALSARGLINAHFFARLRAERPRHDLPEQLEGLARSLSQRTGQSSRRRRSSYALLAVLLALATLGLLAPAPLCPRDAPASTMPAQTTTPPSPAPVAAPVAAKKTTTKAAEAPTAASTSPTQPAPPRPEVSGSVHDNVIHAPGSTVTLIGVQEN